MSELIRKHKTFTYNYQYRNLCAQFILFPNCFPQYYPVSNEATLIFVVPMVFLSVAGNVITNFKIKTWATADVLCGAMLCIYNRNGFYGIGMRGVSLDGTFPVYSQKTATITTLLIVLVLFAFQSLVCAFRLLILKSKNTKV